MLEGLHPHDRDCKITFDEPTHVYTVDGVEYESVTTWNKTHFEEFDPDATIEKMMKSPKWPQSKYFGMEPEAIKASWTASGDEASALGTKLHADIEDYYNGKRVQNDSVEWKFFEDFAADHVHLKPYRTEWRIWDEEFLLAGTIDMVFLNEDDGSVSIYDWKRSKKIEMHNRFRNAKTECINHLSDCNYVKYSLQLNAYKYMLERNYGLKVRNMFLVIMHPDQKGYQKLAVGDMSDIMKKLLELRKSPNKKLRLC